MKLSALFSDSTFSANPLSGWQKILLVIGYIFSFYIVIAFRVGYLPLPFSFLPESFVYYLNWSALLMAIFFLTGGTLWLLFRRNRFVSSLMLISFLSIFLLLCVLITSMLLLTPIRIIHNQINTGLELSEYWSYLVAILTCASFLVIVLTNQSTKRSNEKESEKKEFYRLLDFHLARLEAVTYEENGHYLQGAEAFKKYAEIANKWLTMYLIYEEIRRNDALFKEHMENNIVWQCYKGIYKTFYTKEMPADEAISSDQIRSRLYWIRKEMILPRDFDEKRENYAFWAYLIYINKWNDYRFQYEHMKHTGDLLYHAYGHLLHPYFNNLYCIVEILTDFKHKSNYSTLLTAQLSRYEVSLGMFYILSSRSYPEIVKKVSDIGLYNNLYFKDILYLKDRNEKEYKESQLVQQLLKEFNP